jgi:hypothetical protein
MLEVWSSAESGVEEADFSWSFFSRTEPRLARLSLITFKNSASFENNFSPMIEETYGLKRRTV